MPHNRPISRLATAIPAIAMALATTCIHADSYTQTNLVSDIPGLAANTDPNLKNPWGVSFSATSPFWTADQATGLSTLYNAAGVPQALVVSIPVGAPPSGPTGAVFGNVTGSFLVNGTPATFIFDTLNGTLAGWNASAGTTAVQTAATAGAIYTGLAEASNASGNFLYAANNSNIGRRVKPSRAPLDVVGRKFRSRVDAAHDSPAGSAGRGVEPRTPPSGWVDDESHPARPGPCALPKADVFRRRGDDQLLDGFPLPRHRLDNPDDPFHGLVAGGHDHRHAAAFHGQGRAHAHTPPAV